MGRGDLVPRIITDFAIRLTRQNGNPCINAGPVNLSETGLCLRLSQEPTVGEQVALEIQLDPNGPPITAQGRIVWVRSNRINPWFYCGVGFVDLKQNHLTQIKQYVDDGAQWLVDFLYEFPLFADFSQEDCRNLLMITTLRQLKKHEILYEEGGRDVDLQGLFIVQSGLLRIFKGHDPRPDRQLAVVSAGQIFGEVTLITEQEHTASIMAVNPSCLIQINKLGFTALREKHPKLGLKVMEVVAKSLVARLGRTTQKLFSPVQIK
ncbi:MAG: cyclic nucleotide-binding domain-containing protein [Sedimentisphaerales bacterium]|nr:cyclic nucleotide-binding domain-containing protein [Sedimentisphaerales bacterium]